MQVIWHGRKGPNVNPQMKDNGILTLVTVPEVGKNLGGTLKLMPGVNEVDPADWEKATNPPTAVVKHFFDIGAIEIVQADNLRGKSVNEAKQFIATTIDRKLLAKWRGADDRQEVIAAIDAQLAEMGKKPPKPEVKEK